MDKLVKRSIFNPVNEDEVEDPFFAVIKVDQALGEPWRLPGLEQLLSECGIDPRDSREEYYRNRILEKIRRGDWLLVSWRPFKPLSGKLRSWTEDLAFFTGPASTPPAEPELPPERKPFTPTPEAKLRIALRIGVFFDGTYNNATNAAQGLLCGAQHAITEDDLDASCKPYMRDPESSYGNDVTNIKLLHDLYPNTPTLRSHNDVSQAHRRIYIEGIGTRAGEADSLFGAGTGRGATGVEGKVRQAFEDIRSTCYDFIDENPDYEIESLTLDIFGFSRGAAAARHFANQLAKGRNGPLGMLFPDTSGTFSDNLSGRYGQGVQVAFIGLFDTVASTAGLANLGNVRSPSPPGLQLYLAPEHFPTVVHLVARDEYRANFALNSTAPEHREPILPGAHADLGGGYLAEAEECLLVSPMQALEVPRHTRVEHTSIYRDAEQARDAWLARGWPTELLTIVTPEARPLPPAPTDRLAPPRKRVYAALQLKRPVRGELSRVYLRLMHQLARQHGVRFDAIDEHDPQLMLPADLQPLCDHFLAGDYSTTPADERLLQLHYIHCSAHWNPPARLQGQAPRTGVALTFVNAPTADGQRVRHPHA
ncbi:T6SS phospholipase effector Tle1-like catalytic domain-containing protein [Pseudomonas sp. GCM10022186]|uniref:T6SS phospholipase effector Tle1-like catalytic domain-containing protein n=1 Tax=Pseudomonas sp. GCM10022186 TaxID=3252650 RepID=UPI003615204B